MPYDILSILNHIVTQALESVNQGNWAALSAVFLIAALTEVGVPFPFVIDGILFYAGYRVGMMSVNLILVMAALLAGRIFGSGIIFWGFRCLDKPFTRWLTKHFPRVQAQIEVLKKKLGKRAPLAVALARLTPGLLSPASIASGICIPYLHFLAGVAISSLVADGSLVALGFVTGHGLRYFGLTPSTWMIIIGLVAFLLFIGLMRLLFISKKPRPPRPTDAS